MGNGVITVPGRAWAADVTIPAGETILAISTRLYRNGDLLSLTIHKEAGDPIVLTHGGTAPAGSASLYLSTKVEAGVTPANISITASVITVMFQYSTTANYWRLVAWPTLPTVPDFYDDIPKPDGIGDSGESDPQGDTIARGPHVHPKYSHGNVKALCGAQVAMLGWTEGPTGTWTKDSTGPIGSVPGFPNNWADNAALTDGDDILMGDIVSPHTSLHGVMAGKYTVIDCGQHGSEETLVNSHGVISRSTDADTNGEVFSGMSVYVEGGDAHAGQSWALTTPDPIDLDVTDQTWQSGGTGGGGGGSGVIVHGNTTGRNAPLQHPVSALYDVVTTTTGGGWLVPGLGPGGERANVIDYTCTDDNTFNGIAKHWSDEVAIPNRFEVTVFIVNASPSAIKRAIDGATPPEGSDFAPLRLQCNPSGAASNLPMSHPTTLVFFLDLDHGPCWRLKHPPVGYVALTS